MPIVLIDPAGNTLPPRDRPKRVNRGRADTRLAAVLAPVAPGWVVVPLLKRSAVEVNGSPVQGPTRIHFGDILSLGPARFEVDTCTSPELDHRAPAAADVCRVTVRHHNETVAERTVRKAGSLGTAEDCTVVVPPDTGLDDRHAVLAHVEDRWFLFVISKARGATRFGETEQSFALPLVPGESVWLGEVELTVRSDEVDPLDRHYAPAAVPVNPPTDEPPAPRPAPETRSLAAHSAPTPTSLPDGPARRMTSVSVSRANRPQVAALALCSWLQGMHARTSPKADPPMVTGRPFRAGELHAGTVADVSQFGPELEPDPWDPDALFALARTLLGMGVADGARWVLKELYRQNPHDPVVIETLALLCVDQASDPARRPEDRAADLERACKYLGRATQLRPGDEQLGELLNWAGTELTLLKNARVGAAG